MSNKEKTLIYLKEWRKKNQAKIKEYRKVNREKHKQYMKDYNKGYSRKKDYEYNTADRKQRLKYHLPKKCGICGFTEVLDIHHINGRKHKNDFALKRIKEYIVLCPNCHAKIHRLNYSVEQLLKERERVSPPHPKEKEK